MYVSVLTHHDTCEPYETDILHLVSWGASQLVLASETGPFCGTLQFFLKLISASPAASLVSQATMQSLSFSLEAAGSSSNFPVGVVADDS